MRKNRSGSLLWFRAVCLSGALAVVLLAGAPALAARSAGPIAPARAELKAFEQVARWTSPAVDVAALLRDDEANKSRKDVPLRIGFPMATDLSPANGGTWEALKEGGSIWRLAVRSDGALWVVLGFDVYGLQDGASLWVYDPALKTVMGPYTAADVRDHGQLWVGPVEGDTLVAELFWPEKLHGVAPNLHLGTVSHGYKPFGSIGRAQYDAQNPDKAEGDSGACNIDTMCPLGANWQNEKRGVVILLSGGSGFCSASLINTTANDCRPYVLTANHCSAGASTVFGFNFEHTACGSGSPGPPTTEIVSGASVLANYAWSSSNPGGSDFTLLQMSGAPPEAFNAYFNGWSHATTAPTETHVIHHPSGDVKKISYDADPAVDGTLGGGSTGYGPSHWRIAHYTEGTTEPGSSGSPLFDQNHRIVGQLHGGLASCTVIDWDEYGKVAVSWDGGGTSASRLSDWLDPNVTGELFMNGVDQQVCLFNPAGTVTLTKDTYACTDTLGVTVRDDNLRGNLTQNVTVVSNTETTPQTMILTAREPGSGFFDGTYPVAQIPVVDADGTLSVSPGDTITVTYIDADNGSGGINVPVTGTAVVDCTGPVISGVTATNVTGNSASILWTTNELANSAVTYGTVLPPAGGTASSTALGVSHQVNVIGLNPCTTYYYSVTSTDAAGNTTVDTNGGAYYTFRTGTNTNPTYTYPGPVIPIPDNNPAGATAVINVPYFDYVTKVVVTVNITHTFDGDLSLSLIAPDNRAIPLATHRGSSGANFTATVFDDAAATPISSGTAPFTGSFRPESPLSVLNGMASYGDWKLLAVDSANLDTGSIVSWSVTLSFPPAPCGAQVILDAATYSCTSTVAITVKDTNVAGPSVTVTAKSVTEPGGEVVTLTRQPAPKDTWFQGSIPLTAPPPIPANEQLSVVNADTITVTYIDADDGQGNTNVPVTGTGTTQCVAPVISGVSSSNVTGNSAVVTWTTDVTASSVVHYGTTLPPGSTASAGALVTAHSLLVQGLSPCTTYYYSVESVDAFGNTAVNDNGGAYYTFTTGVNVNPSYVYSGPPVPIPDSNPAGATAAISVLDNKPVLKVTAKVNITHTFDGDLTLHLVGPDGTDVILSNRRGSSGDNFTNTVFDDAATTPISAGTAPFTGSFIPDAALSAFSGKPSLGAWKLFVVDGAASDTGTIQDWTLNLTFATQACGPAVEFSSVQKTEACNGTGTGGGNTIIEPGETVELKITAHDSGTAPVTGVTGILSTSTPGVTITDNFGVFGGIPTNGTATSNLDDFQFEVDPTFTCGSPIDFTITFTATEGTWTSTFSLPTGNPGTATSTYPSTDVPKPIADNTTVTSNLPVANTGTVLGVKVNLSVTHTWDGDVTLTLVAPNGTNVTLSARHGSSGDNYTNTTFDDTAATPISAGTPPYTGSFKPDSPLSVLNGIAANGTWQLKVADGAAGDTGTLTAWSLILTTTGSPTCQNCTPTLAGEPRDLNWLDLSTLQWGSAIRATDYSLYRGVFATLPKLLTADVDSCTRLNTASTNSGPVLVENPPVGSIYWYLVVGHNGSGYGTAGNATAGARILNSSGVCP